MRLCRQGRHGCEGGFQPENGAAGRAAQSNLPQLVSCVTLDKAADDHGRDGWASDPGALPFGAAGNTEQQHPLGDGEVRKYGDFWLR